MTEANSRRRLVVIGVIVIALFAGLLTRLWFLQVTGGEKLAVAAQQNRDRFVPVPAVRGTIFDAKGNVLAQTVPVTTLTVDRQQLSPRPSGRRSRQNLGTLLGITPPPSTSASTTSSTPRTSRCRWRRTSTCRPRCTSPSTATSSRRSR